MANVRSAGWAYLDSAGHSTTASVADSRTIVQFSFAVPPEADRHVHQAFVLGEHPLSPTWVSAQAHQEPLAAGGEVAALVLTVILIAVGGWLRVVLRGHGLRGHGLRGHLGAVPRGP